MPYFVKARYYLNSWVLFFLADCTSSGYHGQSLFILKMAAKYMGSKLHQAFYTGWYKPAGEWRERSLEQATLPNNSSQKRGGGL